MSLVTGKLILLSWEFHFPAPSHQKEKEKTLKRHKFPCFWALLVPEESKITPYVCIFKIFPTQQGVKAKG